MYENKQTIKTTNFKPKKKNSESPATSPRADAKEELPVVGADE